MNVTQQSLARLSTEFPGYLEGAVIDRFFAAFGIQFSAGHWCAGGFSDRFCRSYSETPMDESPEGQIARVAQAGILGVELNNEMCLDDDLSLSSDRVHSLKQAIAQHGLVATNMNTNIWTRAKYRAGGITNPNPVVRRDGLNYCLQVVDCAVATGCPSVQLWPGSDGWDYHFEVNYGRQLDWFIEGCVAIARKCHAAGLKFGTEAKQKEPREGNMILNTTAKAALVAKTVNEEIGAPVMGVVIDYGHEQMVGNQPADSLYLLRRMGVPIMNFHINGAKYNSNDEDRIAGTDDIWRLVEFCYAAIDTGYDGWFGLDQFTYRTDAVRSMALSKEFFANAMKRALQIYAQRDRLERAQATGDAANTIDVVKRHIFGM